MGGFKQVFRDFSIPVVFILISFSLAAPYVLWKMESPQKASVLILDKTVPKRDWREHKALMWVLNHRKVEDSAHPDRAYDYEKDYAGYVPQKQGKKAKIRPFEKALNKEYDLLYLADTYGVYTDDLKDKESENRDRDEHSRRIYGGLTETELSALENNLRKYPKTTLVGEFNTLATPTAQAISKKAGVLMGVEWTGWIGRHFAELDKQKNRDIPAWMLDQYQIQYGRKWDLTGSGYVFIYLDSTIVILQEGDDIEEGGLRMHFAKEGQDSYSLPKEPISYDYWVDIVAVKSKDAQIIAEYKMDLTDRGRALWKANDLPQSFPAIVKYETGQRTAWYLAADMADEDSVSSKHNLKGAPTFYRHTNKLARDDTSGFYWRVYEPLMSQIIKEAAAQ